MAEGLAVLLSVSLSGACLMAAAEGISRLLGRKEATVRSDLRRGRLRLKEILKEAYDFGEIVRGDHGTGGRDR